MSVRLKLDDRERDTIIAALRLWQRVWLKGICDPRP
jgi:hypothetical protein